MAVIYLTKGLETEVDDELYEDLNSYLWYASGLEGRPARRLKGGPRKIIYIYHQILHLLPWVISMHGLCVDHIDGNPLNNRRENLRLCTQKENNRNTIAYGIRQGICYDVRHERYKVYIDQPDQPRINVGTFILAADAEAALINAKKELGIEDN